MIVIYHYLTKHACFIPSIALVVRMSRGSTILHCSGAARQCAQIRNGDHALVFVAMETWIVVAVICIDVYKCTVKQYSD